MPLSEVVELQKVVAPFRGLHTSHMRDEAAGVVDSVRETIAIGEQGGVPTQVSDHKMIGKAEHLDPGCADAQVGALGRP